MMVFRALCLSLVLASPALAAPTQCEYRGGDDITARATEDGGYDVGYGLNGFDDPAREDHCRIVVAGKGEWKAEHAQIAQCDGGYKGPYIVSGSTIDADDDGIIVLLGSVLYRVCR